MSNAASGITRPPQSPRAVVFGEALVDVIDGTAFPGGSPLNVAVGLSRLGVPTRLAARFGDDAHGALIAEHLRASDVAFPEPVTGATTSRAEVVLNEAGQAQYEFTLDSALPETPLDGVELVHTGSLGAVLAPGSDTVVRAFASAADALLSYDPNIRPALMVDHADTLRQVESLAAASHIVKLSDEDAEWLYPGKSADDVLEHFVSLGAKLAVLTRGAAGCLARTATDAFTAPAPSIVVADTVGAGDSFMAALLAAVLDGPLAALLRSTSVPDRDDVTRALEFAVRAAGITSSRVGANPPWAHELVAE
ncbi:carbohydrate kinase family protein [Leucobacter musarum]|uniref:carbohydrate kinase family protein n=1 Tax=Leucobacter musarum TaxID=1930747 RepID=UPI0006A7AA17|nr:carbohydrate kinase [Leucobacter musarum]